MNRRTVFVAPALAAASSGAAAVGPAARLRSLNPTPFSYSQALEVSQMSRLLFISGQVPEDAAGRVPTDFASQCRLAWANVGAQLQAADMSLDNLAKVTIYLSDRRWRGENAQVRREILGPRTPALTIIIAGIYDEVWLLEIEAWAAA